MKKKLLHTLEEAKEADMQDLFQRAYVPTQLSSFEATLRSAKQRQQGQRRAMMVMASLVILSSLYALWPWSSANSIENVRLAPVPTQEIAGQPQETINNQGASLPVAPEESLGSIYGPMNLIISDETGPVIFDGEGTPLLGLRVSVDGEMTEYKTPLTAPGIPLTPGAHYLSFYDQEGEQYGPYWVEIEAGQALEKDFSVMKTPQHLLLLDGKVINRSTSMPTSQPAKTGFWVAKTSTKNGLWVVIDGKSTGYKTPIKKPGIELSAGRHKLEFLDDSGKNYGTYSIMIVAGELNIGDDALRKEAPESAPTSAPSSTGF
jgi:hypothetical protein